ncbi:hypothetical protein HHX47_DHR2000560 [Lentinula edodes]|nr:hypothetical protein HHX47_DHR2000560 [Lentinula edodes]
MKLQYANCTESSTNSKTNRNYYRNKVTLSKPIRLNVNAAETPSITAMGTFWDNPTAQTSSITLQNKGNNADEPSWPDTINFYHTPRPPPKALVKKASPSPRPGGGTDVSNGTETSLSSMHFSAKTERQMEIQERIEELNGKLALLQRSIRVPEGRKDSRTLINMTHNMRIGKWRNQIEKLQELMGSDWALGRTDVVPKGLYGPQSIAC